MMKLTIKKLRAIEEALVARLAGEIDIDVERRDYETALDWAEWQIEKRKTKKALAQE